MRWLITFLLALVAFPSAVRPDDRLCRVTLRVFEESSGRMASKVSLRILGDPAGKLQFRTPHNGVFTGNLPHGEHLLEIQPPGLMRYLLPLSIHQDELATRVYLPVAPIGQQQLAQIKGRLHCMRPDRTYFVRVVEAAGNSLTVEGMPVVMLADISSSGLFAISTFLNGGYTLLVFEDGLAQDEPPIMIHSQWIEIRFASGGDQLDKVLDIYPSGCRADVQ